MKEILKRVCFVLAMFIMYPIWIACAFILITIVVPCALFMYIINGREDLHEKLVTRQLDYISSLPDKILEL